MDLKLSQKVAVVTGASKGIGLAIVRGLLAEGALVVAGSRSTESLERLSGVTAVAVDLSTPTGPADLMERGQRTWSRGRPPKTSPARTS